MRCIQVRWQGYFHSVPNGTLHVHLRSYGLIMATACACPLSPRGVLGCPIPYFNVQTGARECPLCSHYAPSIRTSAEPALVQARSRLLPDSQSGITSRKCRLRGWPPGFRVPFGTGPLKRRASWEELDSRFPHRQTSSGESRPVHLQLHHPERRSPTGLCPEPPALLSIHSRLRVLSQLHFYR